VMEVSGGAWEVARRLEGRVNRVVVVSPDDTGIAQARTKTDKLDARTLAYLLWKGQLDTVWVPDERARVLRRRLSRREQLVHARSRVKNEVHAMLMRRVQGKPRALICSGSSTSPGRSAPSTSESDPAVGTARRSSRPPASSRSCSGACSPASRTTPTSSPR
jgi:hypothetical protein